MLPLLNLKQIVGDAHPVEPEDARSLNETLKRLGLRDARQGAVPDFVDVEARRGVRSLQATEGLKVDGMLRPGGPTESIMNALLLEREDDESGAALPAFVLEESVGRNGANHPSDIARVRTALAGAGYLQPEDGRRTEAGSDLRLAVQRFQRDFNLGRDATIEPGDKSSRTLGRILRVERARQGSITETAGSRELDSQTRPSKGAQGDGSGKEAAPIVGPGGVNAGEDVNSGPSFLLSDNPLLELDPPTFRPVDAGQMFQMLEFDSNGPDRMRAARNSPIEAANAYGLLSGAAREATTKHFGKGPHRNNKADAFRHTLWSYKATKASGPHIAKALLDAHEVSSPNPVGERLMDLYNNNVGRRLATDPRNDGKSDEEVVMEALRNGELQTRPFSVEEADR